MPTNLVQVVIFLAILAILYVFITWLGLPIPQFVWAILGIILVALFVIWAIRFMQRQ